MGPIWTGRSAAIAALFASVPTVADANVRTGGAGVPERAEVTAAVCDTGAAWRCGRRSTLVLEGRHLDGVRAVVFLGGDGRADDRRVRPRSQSASRLSVRVPARARSGSLRLVSPGAGTTKTRTVRIVAPTPPPVVDVTQAGPVAPGAPLYAGSPAWIALAYDTPVASVVEAVRVETGRVVHRIPVGPGAGTATWDGTIDGQPVRAGRYLLRLPTGDAARAAQQSPPSEVRDGLFPIRGRHDLGQSATNDFGGGRGHQGQDMFARCGTPLAAVRPGVVQFAGTQSRAGNYVVLQDRAGESYVYMHMRDPALVRRGAVVRTGQPVGFVGDTGRASGCHVHFERWSAPGWYEGGVAVDPLPDLRRWSAYE